MRKTLKQHKTESHRLNSNGFSHHFLLAAFVTIFALAGISYLVISHAATPSNTSGSTNHYTLDVICEPHGNYCIGAPSISLGAAVKETADGRLLRESSNGNGTLKLEFNADPSRCVGVDGDHKAYVKGCNDLGVGWIQQFVPGGVNYINNKYQSTVLTGHNNGGQMVIATDGCSPNCYQLFDQ